MGPDSPSELIEVLDGWRGQLVAVRLVTTTDDLVAVFVGRLGARSSAKGSSLFWRLEAAARGLAE